MPDTLAPHQFPHLEAAYLAVLGHISRTYEYRNAPRKNAARECLGLSFQIANPRERLPYLAARRTNPAFCFAEALWYLAGRDDLGMMAYYAPQIAAYSPDGRTLVGSAYGTRMFRTPPGAAMAPFDQVLRLLGKETDSKRGVLPIFGAEELAVKGNPDVSCVVALHLLAREGRLHMVCYMRANDCYRGLLSDVFSFTMIQEFAAVRLGLRMGAYTHHIRGPRTSATATVDRAHRPARGSRWPWAAGVQHPRSGPCRLTHLRHPGSRAGARGGAAHQPGAVRARRGGRPGLDVYWQQVLAGVRGAAAIRYCTADRWTPTCSRPSIRGCGGWWPAGGPRACRTRRERPGEAAPADERRRARRDRLVSLECGPVQARLRPPRPGDEVLGGSTRWCRSRDGRTSSWPTGRCSSTNGTAGDPDWYDVDTPPSCGACTPER
ncbi:thymidylate synthase [Streptomyces sp. HK10]|uniref:thymidylate synthase n=1 Tax=Streptomyces sp. HK10 TaxID=3373255 RepID=UPI003748F012